MILPPRSKCRGYEDIAGLTVFEYVKENGDHHTLSLPGIFRHVSILDLLVEFVGSVKKCSFDFPVSNSVTFLQDVFVVDEYCSMVQKACDFLPQLAEVLIADANATTLP